MPLAEQDCYTWEEAIDLITQTLPDEDPAANLIKALSIPFPNELLIAYVVSEGGKRWQITAEAVRAKKNFRYDRETGQGRLRVRGHVEPLIVVGPIEIRKDHLDALLAKSSDVELPDKALAGVPARSQTERKAETAKRNTAIQEVADKIWKSALDEGRRLTKEEVAKQLRKHPDAAKLCRDLKTRAQRMLSEDSLVRLILEPDWLPPPRRKKDIRAPR